MQAAGVCDLAGLARIANEDPGISFRYSIPDGGDPYQHWLGSKFDPTILLVLFSLPHAVRTYPNAQGGEDRYHVWPSVSGNSPTDADWKAAEALYPAETLQRWRQGDGYVGLRTWIQPNGRWWGLLAGD
jgi:hypothetical protein